MYFQVNGSLHKLPNSLESLYKRQQPFTKPFFPILMKEIITPKTELKDDSMYNFAERRMGTEFAKYIIDPVCRGIFAGNAKELSVRTFAKSAFELEQNYGSVIKGQILDSLKSVFRKNAEKEQCINSELADRAKGEHWSVWSLKGGLSTLVKALEMQLTKENIEICKNYSISEISPQNNGKVVISNKEREFIVDKVISCLPAYRLQPLIKSINNDIAQLLESIPFVNVAVVNYEFTENLITEPGFGYLIPSFEDNKMLGVIYDSVLFPHHHNHTILTIMMGGYWYKDSFSTNTSTDHFLDIAVNEVQTTFKTLAIPIMSKVSVLKNCIPQYTLGHFEKILEIRRLLKQTGIPLLLAGSSYDGVGINDCILSAKMAVASLNEQC